MMRGIALILCLGFFCLVAPVFAPALAQGSGADMPDYPVVKLRSLDKVTARTMTFEVAVGSTVRFGSIYIRVQACRKADPTDPPESASFLQIWEVTPDGVSQWVFSGWMFASSPALSPMDHAVYDVWVLDCLERRSNAAPAAPSSSDANNDGEVTGDAAIPPSQGALPDQAVPETPTPARPRPRVEIPGEGGY